MSFFFFGIDFMGSNVCFFFIFTFSLNVSKRKHVVAFVVAMGILYLAILLSRRKMC